MTIYVVRAGVGLPVIVRDSHFVMHFRLQSPLDLGGIVAPPHPRALGGEGSPVSTICFRICFVCPGVLSFVCAFFHLSSRPFVCLRALSFVFAPFRLSSRPFVCLRVGSFVLMFFGLSSR